MSQHAKQTATGNAPRNPSDADWALHDLDKQPISAEGWLALFIYAGVVALLLHCCVYVPPAAAGVAQPTKLSKGGHLCQVSSLNPIADRALQNGSGTDTSGAERPGKEHGWPSIATSTGQGLTGHRLGWSTEPGCGENSRAAYTGRPWRQDDWLNASASMLRIERCDITIATRVTRFLFES